jgi:hypothetical protein
MHGTNNVKIISQFWLMEVYSRWLGQVTLEQQRYRICVKRKQVTPCTYDVTFWCVRLNIVAVKTHSAIGVCC